MVKSTRFIDVIPDRDVAVSTQLTQTDAWVTATITEQVDSAHVAVHIDGADEGTPDTVAVSDSGVTAIGATVRAYRDSTGRIVRVGIPDEIPAGAEVITVGTTGEWLATLDATASTTSAQVEAAQEKADQAAADALASLEAASKAVTDTTDEYAAGASETVPPTTGWSTTPPVRTPGTFIWVRTTVTYGDGNSTTADPVLLTGNTGAQGEQGPPGADGQDGQPGADGVGIASTVVTYAGSTSATTPPTSGWTSQVPTVPQGHYLWTRTVWTYTSGATETGYSVAYMPEDGNDGENGIAGKDGVGIASTTITYAVSSSGTSAPSSGWQAQPPAASPGQFMWTRTVWTYTDATTETGYSVGKIGDTGPKGADGVAGADGVGLTGTALAYALSTSGTSAPSSGWSSTVPTLVKGRYLWTRSVWTYSDGSSETGYSVAYIGTDGSSGTDGLPGKDGIGLTGTTIAYAVSASGTTAPSSGWQATPPAASAGQFMWTRTTWTYSDASTETGYSVGKIGETGATGAAGRGIASTTVTYQASTSGTTAPTGTWTETVPMVAAGSYLWTRTVITYTDSTTTTAYAVGRMGTNGANGTPGTPGADGATTYLHVAYSTAADGSTGFSTTDPSGRTYLGTYTDTTEADSTSPSAYTWVKIQGPTGSTGPSGKGIASSTVTYQGSASGTTAPTGTWSSTVPTVAQGQYLWTRTVIVFTDGASTTTYAVARMGVDGEDGATGAAGRGITSTTVTYQASSSGTTVPTGTWTSSIPSVAANQYLWTRTVIAYTDNTSTTGYSIGKMGATGADGAAGSDGRGVQSTAVTYQASSSGTTVPTGSWSSTIPTVSAGQYLWTRTVITYTDATTSTSYAIGKMGEQGAKGDKGSTGATGTSVTSVTTYYRTVTKGAAAPAKPTASPAPSPWTTTEPAYADNTELYRTDRIVYSTGSFAYTDVSKVSAYTAAAQAITVANLVEAAAQGLVKPSATDPGHYKGRIWLQLNAQGRTVGIKVSNGTAWTSYALMADSILVPGSIGTVSIGENAVTAPKIYATSELWTKMLNVAGNATIGGSLLAQELIGKIFTGGTFRTATTGQRVEISSNNRITLYSPNGKTAGAVYAINDGATGGWIVVTPDISDTSKGIILGTYNLPHSGSVTTQLPSVATDELVLPGNSADVHLTGAGVSMNTLTEQTADRTWEDILRPTIAGRRRSTTRQNISSDAWTRHTVPADVGSETWNVGGTISSGAGIAVPVAGLYEVKAALMFSGNTSGRRIVTIYIDSAKQNTQVASNPTNVQHMTQVCDVLKLNAGDEVLVGGYQNSGSILTMDEHVLSVTYIGPA